MNEITGSEVSDAADQINESRAVEVETRNISTVNEMIREHELSIIQAEADIDSYRDGVRSKQKDIKRRLREMDKLRERRDIFMRAKFELERNSQP